MVHENGIELDPIAIGGGKNQHIGVREIEELNDTIPSGIHVPEPCGNLLNIRARF